MKRSVLFMLLFATYLIADDFESLSANATAARQANNLSQAIDLYRQALHLNAQWQEGWWFLGRLLYQKDQYAEAGDAFQHMVELNAQAGPVWGFLGLCEFNSGNYAKALADIEHALSMAIDKDPQLGPLLLYHQALLITKGGDFDRALQKYAQVISREAPGSTLNDSLLTAIGLAALRAPLLPGEVPAGEARRYLVAGQAASSVLMGNYAEAESRLSLLLSQYGNTPNVHYMHAVYLLARDPEGAWTELKRELQISPLNAAACTMLAWSLLNAEDAAAALPYAEKSAQLQAGNSFATYLVGRALVETGAIKRGLNYLLQAEKADASNSDVHVALAAAYSRVGEPQQARRERETALQTATESGTGAHP